MITFCKDCIWYKHYFANGGQKGYNCTLTGKPMNHVKDCNQKQITCDKRYAKLLRIKV